MTAADPCGNKPIPYQVHNGSSVGAYHGGVLSTEPFVSNEEYYERWEDSAPTPVDTGGVVARRTGKTWNEEMDGDTTIDAALQKQIEEYAKTAHDSSSNQTKEEYARQREMSADVAEEYQFVKPDEYNDAKERIGVIMHASDFLKRLQATGVNCWFARHVQAGKTTLVFVNPLSKVSEVGCWLMSGNMPELSIMRFDEHGVPLDEAYRGWRTGLLQLILKGVISERKAVEVYGPPKTTKAFHRYNSLLQNYRNAGSRLEEK